MAGATSPGSVIDTLDLTNGTLVPGNFLPSNGLAPVAIAADGANNELFAVDSLTDDLTVINGSSSTLLASVPVGPSPTAVAYDGANGDVYVAGGELGLVGEVTVVNATTYAVVGSVSTGNYPDAIAYDSANGFVYVVDGNVGLPGEPTPPPPGYVTVINGSTDALVGSITVGDFPDGIAYDSANGYLYVANFNFTGFGSVTVINGSTDAVVSTVSVGMTPVAVGYDSSNGHVYVADDDQLTVINGSTDAVLGSTPAGSDPKAVVADPASGEVFVVDEASDMMTVINGSSDTLEGTIPVGTTPSAAAYDGANGDVYVTNYDSDNVTVVNGSTGEVLGAILLGMAPSAAAYDGTNGEIYVTELDSDNVSEIDGGTDGVVGSVPVGAYPDAVAFDDANGYVYVANAGSGAFPASNVTVINGATEALVRAVSVGESAASVTYDAANGYVYVANSYSNNVSVIDGATDSVVASVSVGSNPNGMAYDGANEYLYVADFGSNNVTVINGETGRVVGSIPVGSGPLPAAYDRTNGFIYVANELSGNVSVIAGATGRVVGSVPVGSYPDAVTFDATNGYLYVANAVSDNVTVIDGASDAVVGSVAVGSFPDAAAFDASNGDLYVANAYSGSVSIVRPAPITEPTNFTVTITETGLPAEMSWPATVLVVPDGVYPYSVPRYVCSSLGCYGTAQSSGVVTVSGSDVTIVIAYTAEARASTSLISFSESGLAARTAWGVTIHGPVNLTLNDTTTGQVGSYLMSGTYTVQWSLVGGYSETGPTEFNVSAPARLTVHASYDRATVVVREQGLARGTIWSFGLACASPACREGSGTVNASFRSTGAADQPTSTSLRLPDGNYTIVFAPVSGYTMHAATQFNVSLTRTVTVTVVYDRATVTLRESGLPRNVAWGFNITCESTGCRQGGDWDNVSWSGVSASDAQYLADGSYAVTFWTVHDETSYATSELNVTLARAQTVVVSYDQGRVTFSETGLARGTLWGVNITGPVDYTLAGSTPTLVQPLADGSYRVQFWNETDHSLYATTTVNVTRTVAQTVHVAYDQARITFTESGLPSGTLWAVNVSLPSGLLYTVFSTGTSLEIPLSDGSWSVHYWSPAIDSLVGIPPTVTVVVSGTAAQTIHSAWAT